jgi:starch synthase
MHIVHIASELAPIAKAGGLGDVIYSLSKQLQRQGETVEILLPKYDCIDYSLLKDLKPVFRELWSYDGYARYNNTIWGASIDGLNVLLVETHHPSYFFTRGKIYNCDDDIDRFIYFSRTCMEYLYKSGKNLDIVHVHDWTTAMCAVLYKEMYIPLGLRLGGVVMTLHNVEYQGKCLPQNITRSGLRGDELLSSDKMQDPQDPRLINILKGGINYSDAVTVVSPTYEKEIKTEGGSHGLSQVIINNQKKLHGILNGIDLDYWNPQTDPYLSQHYSQLDYQKGKALNKNALRKKLGLKESTGPLVCSITRLVPQKDPALIKRSIEKTLEQGGQFVLLGSSSIPEIETIFLSLQKKLSKNKNAVIYLKYDEPLAHLLYAASDMIVIPSLFEPCGLTQMIACRYAAVPIVRATGGLADTVFEERNGFTFQGSTTKELDAALEKAFACFTKTPEKWTLIVLNGLQANHGWEKSAKEYLAIYKKLLSP